MTMDVYHSLEDVPEERSRGRTVAIGVFDGVHRGHQEILRRAVSAARRLGAACAAVTFYPHPEVVLRPRTAPRMLTLPERKAELIAELGVDELVILPFDRRFAALSPEAFCTEVLSERLGAREVFVGENFRFGRDGLGSPADLSAYGGAHGFQVTPVSLTRADGEVISSTRIRTLLASGRVAAAADLLGRPHRVQGQVVSGAGRGRTLDAPTANLLIPRELALPRKGVYVTRSFLEDGTAWPSVTSIGTNPTFEKDRKVRVETLLLDFAGELYGSRLEVDFLERIRSQRRFVDPASLAARISEDVHLARKYFFEGA